MIISQTCLRVSFVGGGSDIPVFYRRHGGAVVSTGIDKYIYVMVNRRFDDGIRIAYSKTEEVARVRDIEHKIVRATLDHLHISGGLEIATIADIPAQGSGLGSSSTFTVGLLSALKAFKGVYASREQLAAESCKVEIDLCGEPIGKQDQYAAAFGGLNMIEFMPDDTVVVSPIICLPSTLTAIQQNMMLLYTGMTRSASQILRQQSDILENDVTAQNQVQKMVRLAHSLREELQSNNADAFGEILHEGWLLKRSLTSNISNSLIDDWYKTARGAGAIGGKILGAGAGGYLLLYAPPNAQARIAAALPALRPTPFRFEQTGSRIVYYKQAGN